MRKPFEELAETLAVVERIALVIDEVASLSVCFVKPQTDLYYCPGVYQIALHPAVNLWYQWSDLGRPAKRTNDQRRVKLQLMIEAWDLLTIPIEGIHAFE